MTKRQADRLWLAVTALDEFSVVEVAREARVSTHLAVLYLTHCFRHGVIEMVPKVGLSSSYRKTEMVGNIGGPGNGRTMEGKVWEAIRQTRIFTVREIAALADSEAMRITEDFVLEYVRTLMLCDYVRQQPGNAKKPAGLPRFQLLKNTGPKPPSRRRVRLIVDPNIEEIVHMPELSV
jgi:hypothetical protein